MYLASVHLKPTLINTRAFKSTWINTAAFSKHMDKHSSLISSLNHDYSYQTVFHKPGLSPVVSLLVPPSLVHSCMPG